LAQSLGKITRATRFDRKLKFSIIHIAKPKKHQVPVQIAIEFAFT